MFQCSFQFKHVPLYLEWAPVGVFNKDPPASADAGSESTNQTVKGSAKTSGKEAAYLGCSSLIAIKFPCLHNGFNPLIVFVVADSGNESDDAVHNPGCILFVKNLNFNTTEQKLKKVRQFIQVDLLLPDCYTLRVSYNNRELKFLSTVNE